MQPYMSYEFYKIEWSTSNEREHLRFLGPGLSGISTQISKVSDSFISEVE